MTTRAPSSRPRRGLNLVESAFYVGVSPEKFTALMDTGRMPQPRLIDSVRVWDLDELDVYFAGLPRDTRSPRERQADRRAGPYHPPKPAKSPLS